MIPIPTPYLLVLGAFSLIFLPLLCLEISKRRKAWALELRKEYAKTRTEEFEEAVGPVYFDGIGEERIYALFINYAGKEGEVVWRSLHAIIKLSGTPRFNPTAPQKIDAAIVYINLMQDVFDEEFVNRGETERIAKVKELNEKTLAQIGWAFLGEPT